MEEVNQALCEEEDRWALAVRGKAKKVLGETWGWRKEGQGDLVME